MITYEIGDTIKFKREGCPDGLGQVFQKLPNGCFVQSFVPQYSVPIQVMVRNSDVIGIERDN